MLPSWGRMTQSTNTTRKMKSSHFFILSYHLVQTLDGASPALAQLLVFRLEHVEFLGKADDDHEEQQDHQS